MGKSDPDGHEKKDPDGRAPSWESTHMGEGVRWENRPTWEKWTRMGKINPDGKKWTQMGKRTFSSNITGKASGHFRIFFKFFLTFLIFIFP